MAKLPPKDKRLSPSSWRVLKIGLALALLCAVLVAIWVSFDEGILADGSVDAATWVGFWGGIISAVIGGMAAYIVLRFSIAHESNKQEAVRALERERTAVSKRVEVAEDLMGKLNFRDPFPSVYAVAHEGSRLARRLASTWKDQHEGRHILIPLTASIAEFEQVVADLGPEDVPEDEQMDRLVFELMPAMIDLLDAIVEEYQLSYVPSSGLPPTVTAATRLQGVLHDKDVAEI